MKLKTKDRLLSNQRRLFPASAKPSCWKQLTVNGSHFLVFLGIWGAPKEIINLAGLILPDKAN